jgi:Transposase DDE domain
VKTTGVGGENRGYELGGKKVKGRKRHLLVDTEGLVLKAKVHSAKVLDQEGIKSRCSLVLGICSRAFHTSVGGRWLQGRRERQRLGGEGLGMDGGPR